MQLFEDGLFLPLQKGMPQVQKMALLNSSFLLKNKGWKVTEKMLTAPKPKNFEKPNKRKYKQIFQTLQKVGPLHPLRIVSLVFSIFFFAAF